MWHHLDTKFPNKKNVFEIFWLISTYD
jgi:hypothetical protein